MERFPGVGLSFEQAERFCDGVDQRPVEVEQRESSAVRENYASHALARDSALGEFAAQLIERDGLIARYLCEAGLEGR